MCRRARRRLSDLMRGSRAWPADHHFWMFEMKGIVRASLSEGEHTRDRCSSAPRAAGALLIVLPQRRNSPETNRGQRSDVDAHFHRGGAAQDINGRLVLSQRNILKRSSNSSVVA